MNILDIKVIKKEEKPLVGRTEVELESYYTAAVPDRKVIRKALADAMHVEQDVIIIEKIMPTQGFGKAKVTASVYNNKELMTKLTPEYVIKRHDKKKKEAA